MIERLLELVLANVFKVLILLFITILGGILFSNSYWTSQVRKRDSTIRDMEASIEEKDVNIEKLHLAQEILKKQYAEIESLNRQLEEKKRDRIRLSQQINDKFVDFERNFKTQIENREQNIRTLNNQVNEKNESIDLLKNKVANLEEMNQESVNLTEQLKTNLTGLEKSVEEKMIEVSSINARMSIMQDDLTHIVGIGPKVSSVLRLAGIDSFTKLGSINLNKLKEILEAENPNLLRLTDPSTWPEQAKLASEEDWEALSTLQESLKGSRRTRQQLNHAS